jgi:large subunit ribosomal protein L31
MSTEFAILTKSCIETEDTIKWEDGNEYPLVKMEISSDSHPFYTGKAKLIDTAGRIDKFKNKYKKFQK